MIPTRCQECGDEYPLAGKEAKKVAQTLIAREQKRAPSHSYEVVE